MPAFRFAVKNKSAIGLDTMFSKSGELVVIHDSDLERTTDGKGLVEHHTLAELKDLDASMLSLENFKGEKIPTLEEVINEFGNKSLINIEIKAKAPTEDARKIGKAVANLITEKKIEGKVFVTSFNPYVLESVKNENSNIIRGQLYSNFEDMDKMPWFLKIILRNLWLNQRSEPDILVPKKNLVNSDYIDKYQKLGYKIFPWTVNDPKEIENLIKLGIDGLITDRPDLAYEIYSKLKNQ